MLEAVIVYRPQLKTPALTARPREHTILTRVTFISVYVRPRACRALTRRRPHDVHENGSKQPNNAHQSVWGIGDRPPSRRTAPPTYPARAGAAGLSDRASRCAALTRQAGRPALAGPGAAPGPAYALGHALACPPPAHATRAARHALPADRRRHSLLAR